MTSNSANFIGNIPHHYDAGLGPVVFVDYAADMARRVGVCPVSRVLETAAVLGLSLVNCVMSCPLTRS